MRQQMVDLIHQNRFSEHFADHTGWYLSLTETLYGCFPGIILNIFFYMWLIITLAYFNFNKTFGASLFVECYFQSFKTFDVQIKLRTLNTRKNSVSRVPCPPGAVDRAQAGVMSGWRDSNPHALRHQILSLARLPITPHPVNGYGS